VIHKLFKSTCGNIVTEEKHLSKIRVKTMSQKIMKTKPKKSKNVAVKKRKI